MNMNRLATGVKNALLATPSWKDIFGSLKPPYF